MRATKPRPMIQVALNGSRTKAEHLAMPVTAEELIADAVACVAVGAGAIHLHPRGLDGAETVAPEVVNDLVARVRDAAGIPVGVSAGAWIEPDLRSRMGKIRRWTAPDYASVNLSEEGALEVMRTLLDTGVGIEAGVWTVEDATHLGDSGLGSRMTRVLVEPGELQVGTDTDAALELVGAIHAELDRYAITVPRLQHGDGRVAWVILRDAFVRGIGTRIGFEDTLVGPDGEPVASNAELVRAAVGLRGGN